MTSAATALHLALLLALAGDAAAQVDWRQASPVLTPPRRLAHRLAYDSLRSRIVMYGGGSGLSSTLYYETWAWDGMTWTQLVTQSAPDGIVMPGIAYDRARDRVVVYGGHQQGSTASANTWEFDGAEWHQAVPVHAPPVRGSPVLTYHAGIQRVVLFGGWLHHDTWLWDGTDWTQVVTPVHPIAREGHGLVYDAARDVVVLFGGRDNGATPLDDTWEFDGVRWTRIWPAHSPPPRAFFWMAYDPDRQRVVEYGGDAFVYPIWEYDGADWSSRQVNTQLTARFASQDMAYDEASRTMVTFGYGATRQPETWELVTVTPADVRSFGAGCAPPCPARIVRAEHEWPWIGDVFEQQVVGSATSVVAFLLLGVSNTEFAGTPLPLSLDPAGVPGCSLLVSPDWIGSWVMQGGTATIPLAIPTDPRLLGARLFEQALVHDPALPGSFTASDGQVLTFGSR